MAEVSLTAAFSTVPADEAERFKRVIVETVDHIARDDGTFKKAKRSSRSPTSAAAHRGTGRRQEGGVPLSIDIDTLEAARRRRARAPREEALRLFSGRCKALAWTRRPALRVPGLPVPRAEACSRPRRARASSAAPSSKAGERVLDRAGFGLAARAGGEGGRDRGGPTCTTRRRAGHSDERRPQRCGHRRAPRRLLCARDRRALRSHLHNPPQMPTPPGRERGDAAAGGRQRRPRRMADPRPRHRRSGRRTLRRAASSSRSSISSAAKPRSPGWKRQSFFPPAGTEDAVVSPHRLERIELCAPSTPKARSPAARHRRAWSGWPSRTITVTRRLIVNADDYGITRGVSEGILAPPIARHRDETTVLVTGDMPPDLVDRARECGLGSACTSTSRSARR